jgi:hypothetical protein
VWLTYGSFVCDDGQRDWQWHAAFGRRYEGPPRALAWRASHLKTFRAGLVQRIPYTYLQDRTGLAFTTCLDRAVMFPLLDMAGERYAVATDPLVVYHRGHGASERGTLRESLDLAEIHGMAPLPRLSERPW